MKRRYLACLVCSPGAVPASVFINHIELLSASAQMQLASFIENGDQAALSLSRNQLRIVAGTAINLQALVEQGLFREDLFFEFSVAVLSVPPLRDRAEDIPQIAHLLCLRFTEELGVEKTLDEEAVIVLQGYEWPGNIRELELILKRLFLSAPQASLSAHHNTGNHQKRQGRTCQPARG